MIRAALLALLLAVLPCVAMAQDDSPRVTFRGIELYAIPLKPDARFDVPIVDSQKGLLNVQASLDLLLRRSPFAANAVDRLRRNGRVMVVYDPNYPEKQFVGNTIAAFFPTYFHKSGDFLVLVGRHGIKWPMGELAAVLAHELVGHGMQRLRGDLATLRNLDAECEAWLYEEKAYQDLGVDKLTRGLVAFRIQLENRACADFRVYQRRHAPATLKLWEARNPNVPRLLSLFRDYAKLAPQEAGEPGS